MSSPMTDGFEDQMRRLVEENAELRKQLDEARAERDTANAAASFQRTRL